MYFVFGLSFKVSIYMTKLTELLNSTPTLLDIMVCNVLSAVMVFALYKSCKWFSCVLNIKYRKWKWRRKIQESGTKTNKGKSKKNKKPISNDEWEKFETIQSKMDEDDFFLKNF